MLWGLVFDSDAEKDLSKLDKTIQKRIIVKLDKYLNNFNDIEPLALTGKWQGFFKFRVGDYRIIYDINYKEKEIIILIIGHRSRIYKK